MSVIDHGIPVRRSPLAHWHRGRGARFVATGEWPATYGDLQRERRAVRERVALLDAGPLDKISLSGARVAPAPPAPAYELGRVTAGSIDGRDAQLWGLAEDTSLLVVPAVDARSSSALSGALEADGIQATDVSSLYAALQLTGPRVHAILEEVFPVDVSDRALPDRAVTFGPLALVTAIVARIDVADLPSFTVLVERDQAEYLWDALLRIGDRYGLEPVGAAALAED